jgi:hypothetical protein
LREAKMMDNEILLAIQEKLDGVEWKIEALEEIARLLRDNGLPESAISTTKIRMRHAVKISCTAPSRRDRG